MAEPKLFDKLFFAWEGQTAEYFEKLLRDPAVLSQGGAMLNTFLRAKIATDHMLAGTWRALLLPNKRDQERTLHVLNEIQSQLLSMDSRLRRLEAQNAAGQGAAPGANADAMAREKAELAALKDMVAKLEAKVDEPVPAAAQDAPTKRVTKRVTKKAPAKRTTKKAAAKRTTKKAPAKKVTAKKATPRAAAKR